MLPLKSDDVNATVLPDGRWLLYDRIEHVALTLAAPAGILWELCDGQSSVEQLVTEFGSLYPDIPVSNLETEIRQTLITFLEQGLIAYHATETS